VHPKPETLYKTQQSSGALQDRKDGGFDGIDLHQYASESLNARLGLHEIVYILVLKWGSSCLTQLWSGDPHNRGSDYVSVTTLLYTKYRILYVRNNTKSSTENCSVESGLAQRSHCTVQLVGCRSLKQHLSRTVVEPHSKWQTNSVCIQPPFASHESC
jgi:hypothetical protein